MAGRSGKGTGGKAHGSGGREESRLRAASGKAGKPGSGKPGSGKATPRSGTRSPKDRRPAGRPAAPRRTRRRGLAWHLVKWCFVLAIWGGVGLAGLVAVFAYDLPDTSALDQVGRRPSVTILAADGSRLASFGDVFGDAVSLHDMPPYLPQAVLATEDRRFYDHFGLDLIGLVRAAFVNLREGRVVQGGSTITQQLAKNLFLTPERTLRRKVQEFLLALWLEHRYSKEQILTIYLNRVYLGAGTYGVDAAARRYFDRPAREISVYQAALLAGLLRAPSRWAPTRDPEGADARARTVLGLMVQAGYLAPDEAARALRQPEGYRRPALTGGSRYFADWVLEQLPGYVGRLERDLVVVTTLDPHLQNAAEAAVREGLAAHPQAGQAALAALDPDGAVRAMVGGRSYAESQFNRAAQARRQPGSAFKLFVFLAAIEAGLTPDTLVEDSPVRIGNWAPGNFNDRYEGMVTVRRAFAHSLNSAAVRLAQHVGAERIAAVARRLGITSTLTRDLSLALGTSEVTLLELTAAYGVFGNGGEGVWPYAIEEIRDSGGQVLWLRSGGGPGLAVASAIRGSMTDLLRAVVQDGSGRSAALPGVAAAGKTGTTQDSRDAWFVGWAPGYAGRNGRGSLTAGVWLGHDDGRSMGDLTGGSAAAETWRRFMERALRPPAAAALR